MGHRDNLPLNVVEKMNARVSMAVASVLLVIICVVFNRLDYVMIRKPAEEALQEQEEAAVQEEEVAAAAQSVSAARIVAVGDNFLYGNVVASGKRDDGTYSYAHLYDRLRPEISGADLALITQEAPLTARDSQISGDYPYVNPAQLGKDLASAGFDAVALATDYMALLGTDLIGNTVSAVSPMTALGVHQEGGSAGYQVISAGDLRIGLVDFTTPIVGRTTSLSTGDYEDGYYGSDGTYYVYNEDTGEYEAQEESSSSTAYELDLLRTQEAAAAISAAKQSSDCVICLVHWGDEQEAMPNEYQKQWANFFLQQGVDVVVGCGTHCLAPYGVMSGSGRSMLLYYGLGNFVSTGNTLTKLLGGMASFTVKKTVSGGTATISIEDYDLTPLVMHYSYQSGEFAVYKLSDYTEDLASVHSARTLTGIDLTKALLDQRSEEILSMKVSPSEKTYLLDSMVDEDQNYYDFEWNGIVDTDTVSSDSYYAGAGSPGGSGGDDDESYDDEDSWYDDEEEYSDYDEDYDDYDYDDYEYDEYDEDEYYYDDEDY